MTAFKPKIMKIHKEVKKSMYWKEPQCDFCYDTSQRYIYKRPVCPHHFIMFAIRSKSLTRKETKELMTKLMTLKKKGTPQ